MCIYQHHQGIQQERVPEKIHTFSATTSAGQSITRGGTHVHLGAFSDYTPLVQTRHRHACHISTAPVRPLHTHPHTRFTHTRTRASHTPAHACPLHTHHRLVLNGFDIVGRILVKPQMVYDLALVGYDLALVVKPQVARSLPAGQSHPSSFI